MNASRTITARLAPSSIVATRASTVSQASAAVAQRALATRCDTAIAPTADVPIQPILPISTRECPGLAGKSRLRLRQIDGAGTDGADVRHRRHGRRRQIERKKQHLVAEIGRA